MHACVNKPWQRRPPRSPHSTAHILEPLLYATSCTVHSRGRASAQNPPACLPSRLDDHDWLASVDGLAVLRHQLDHLTRHLRLNLVHELHGLNDADRLALLHAVANLDKHGLARRGRRVEGARHGRAQLNAVLGGRRRGGRLRHRCRGWGSSCWSRRRRCSCRRGSRRRRHHLCRRRDNLVLRLSSLQRLLLLEADVEALALPLHIYDISGVDELDDLGKLLEIHGVGWHVVGSAADDAGLCR
mmetsp:Transcript_33336/g.99278  ORF Transcript_33336/g.99278 Transcript_33336/m.99278 type:complete len:243 (+) Transcript_33336:112-840(+)